MTVLVYWTCWCRNVKVLTRRRRSLSLYLPANKCGWALKDGWQPLSVPHKAFRASLQFWLYTVDRFFYEAFYRSVPQSVMTERGCSQVFKEVVEIQWNIMKHPNISKHLQTSPNISKQQFKQQFKTRQNTVFCCRLKPGPAVMELHGRQSLTKRMLVFQQFMDSDLSCHGHGMCHGMAWSIP